MEESVKFAAVEVEGLSKSYGTARVLRDIGFDVDEGEILVLLGSSGSGKTTILRIVAGLDSADRGTVTFRGKDVTYTPARERGTGVIFQSYALFPKMNVEKNVAFGMKLRKKSKDEIRDRVEELISLVRLEPHRKKYPSQLSGGQQQRVAIARALAYEPNVLLFDEPFGALDAQIRTDLRREIRALLKAVKVPSIFITHDQEEALELADRIAVLNEGRIEQIGNPYEVYMKPKTEYVAMFLGAANLLLGRMIAGRFESTGGISIKTGKMTGIREGQSAKLVFRPEDVFLRESASQSQDYQYLAEATVREVSFVGAFERLVLTLDTPSNESIAVTRPKTETIGFRLRAGQKVSAGIIRFRLLPNFPLSSERSGVTY